MFGTVQVDHPRDIIIGVAITSILLAGSIYMPVIGFFCALFIPLPVFFYRAKLGRKAGMIVPVLSIILIMGVLSSGLLIENLFLIKLLLLGFVLSEIVELNLSVEKTILYACCAVLLAGLFVLFFLSGVYDIRIVDMVNDYVAKNLELTLDLYKNMGVSEENVFILTNALEHIQYIIVRIIPALAIISTLFITWASLLLAKPIFKAKNLFYPDFGSLNLWKAPEYLVWGVIGCGLMLILPDQGIKILGLNGMIIFMIIYFFAGIAIVSFYFEKKNFSRILKFLLYSIIGLQKLALFFVIGLGFFDIWLNFRKLKTKKS